VFTWIPIHREAIHRILEHRQNQRELLTILREMEQQGLTVISLQDKGADGQTIPLAEIDPFSFLATVNRGAHREESAYLSGIATRFHNNEVGPFRHPDVSGND